MIGQKPQKLLLNLIRHAIDLTKELINVKVSVVPDCIPNKLYRV